MKNLVVFLTVFTVLFSAAPAIGQRLRFEDFIERRERRTVDNRTEANKTSLDKSRSVIVSEENLEPLDLALAEVRHKLFEKGFKLVSDKSEAQLEVEVKISSDSRLRCDGDGRSYSNYRYCYLDTEFFAYVSLNVRENGSAYAEGRGKNRRFQRAVEKAADEAADQINGNIRKNIAVFIKR